MELEFRFAHTDAPGTSLRFHTRCVTRHSGGIGLFWLFAPSGEWAEASTHVETFVTALRLD